MPDDVEIASAIKNGGGPVAVVASRRDGPDLLGWGCVASHLAAGPVPEEVIVAAPTISTSTRSIAAAAARQGPPLRLVSVPALAEAPEDLFEEELLPGEQTRDGWQPASSLLRDRVLRIVEGAAVLTGVGAVRSIAAGYAVYMRGVLVLTFGQEGEGVGVECFEPEKRHVHISEANLPRWGLELHETIVEMAQDPRLQGREEAQRYDVAERAAAAAGVRITARSMPWTADGEDPVDWIGIDASSRPVIGLVRPWIGLAHVATLMTALYRVTAEPGVWAPGTRGRMQVALTSSDVDAEALAMLEVLDLDTEARPLGSTLQAGAEGERRGRRRSRRRRRPPAGGAATADAAGLQDTDTSEDAWAPEDAIAPPVREEATADEPLGLAETGEEEAGEQALEEEAAPSEAGQEPAPGESEASPALDSELVELEIEATLAEVPAEGEEFDPEPVEQEQRRRRRQRAAIAVRNDPDSILAALVLARDRRHLIFFYVCDQAELMDFFRGKATDLEENADLLLVGFTAQPLPREVIASAALYSGRLQWLDHHDWPIEDVEGLREAIGSESITFAEGASSSLVAVLETTERRSRFTDKLLDLCGRRLSESDMAKWGYRLMGLIRKMCEHSGDYRSEISPLLSGKPAELPEVDSVYAEEEGWLEGNDPRLVHFGEYQMTVLEVPAPLDAGEVSRRARLKTGARLSLTARQGDDMITLSCTEEKRHVNVLSIVEHISTHMPWARVRPGGDRAGRFSIEELAQHPERLEAVIGEIVRHKSILYG
jgi:hypothetical protein